VSYNDLVYKKEKKGFSEKNLLKSNFDKKPKVRLNFPKSSIEFSPVGLLTTRQARENI